MVGHGTYGGAEKFATEYYSRMDHSLVHFDFAFLHHNEFADKNKFQLQDSQIYELNTWNPNKISIIDSIRTIKKLSKIIKFEGYKIVHVNSGIMKVQLVCLIAAMIGGANTRIAHSHTSNSAKHKYHFLSSVKRKPIRCLATDYFACSKGAGKYLFGAQGISNSKFKIIPNAIELERYRYNSESEKNIREREHATGKIILGHIGRFAKVKNHKFVIDVFEAFRKLNKESELWLIGEGELLEGTKQYVSSKNLDAFIRFFGARDDVADILQSIDAVVFPSFHEGLSIVIVEAQAAGAFVFASDTLSNEHTLSDHIEFLDLNSGAEFWAEEIENKLLYFKRDDNQAELIKQGYDINHSATILQDFYLSK